MNKVIITIDVEGQHSTRHTGRVTAEQADMLIDVLKTCYDAGKYRKLMAQTKARGKKR